MQRLRTQHGFTIFELMIVLAIIGVVTALAVPNFNRYRLREQARESATLVARVLRDARQLAIKTGTQQLVVFNPAASPAGTVVRVIQDVDASWDESTPDIGQDFAFASHVDAQVTPYGSGNTPFSSAGRAPGDPGSGDLTTITAGASFPDGPNGATEPGLGFTPRGVPIAVGTPNTWGSGSGAWYVTDGVSSVFAVVVGPLGEVRILSLRGAANDWV